MTKHTLIVKRHPEGYHYVPFDHDPHEDREAIVDAYIAALVKEGHEVEVVRGWNHHGVELAHKQHPLDFHLKLKSGPRSHLAGSR